MNITKINQFDIEETGFEGLVVLTPNVNGDERGFFFESYNEKAFETYPYSFVQDNQSGSTANVLRGLHFQKKPNDQAKLIRVLVGKIWDVVVDLRQDSPTFSKHFGIELSSQNKKQLFIPRGFAHGYSVLSDFAEVLYKCDSYYEVSMEGGVLYNDPDLQIDWKIDLNKAIISDRDQKWPLLKDCYKF